MIAVCKMYLDKAVVASPPEYSHASNGAPMVKLNFKAAHKNSAKDESGGKKYVTEYFSGFFFCDEYKAAKLATLIQNQVVYGVEMEKDGYSKVTDKYQSNRVTFKNVIIPDAVIMDEYQGQQAQQQGGYAPQGQGSYGYPGNPYAPQPQQTPQGYGPQNYQQTGAQQYNQQQYQQATGYQSPYQPPPSSVGDIDG